MRFDALQVRRNWDKHSHFLLGLPVQEVGDHSDYEGMGLEAVDHVSYQEGDLQDRIRRRIGQIPSDVDLDVDALWIHSAEGPP